MKRPHTLPEIDPALERQLAVGLFNFVWTLLEKEQRSTNEDDLMIHAAHASRLHWERPGAPVNHVRGEWQVSRVYAALGRGEPSLHHARRCLELCEEHGIGDFDLAYAYEALARAHSVAGAREKASRYAGLAREQAERVADREDREHLLEDLATLP
jgi:hypothetical protein